MPSLARLLALHPKRIDLSLDRIERLLAALGHPRAAAAAGDPCRRHQRQGFDHRLHARDPRSGRQARARLYLAQSGAPQRALPHRRDGGGKLVDDAELADALRRMRSQERRRADHRVRDRDGGGVSAVRAPSGRCAAARSRARRPARRHQCRRAAAGERRSRASRSTTAIFSATRSSRSRPRRPASSSRGVPAVDRQSGARGARRDRAAGRAACRRRCSSPARTGPRPRNAAGWSIRTSDGLLDLPAPKLYGRHQFENAGAAIAALRAGG